MIWKTVDHFHDGGSCTYGLRLETWETDQSIYRAHPQYDHKGHEALIGPCWLRTANTKDRYYKLLVFSVGWWRVCAHTVVVGTTNGRDQ
jgi:hypothetical protein